jgi:uncharacterized protein YutE (UPF0331/DUF86 family)
VSVSADQAAIIVDKAEFVEECLGILVERQSVDRKEYANRIEVKDVVERRFEMMTQACIDIARTLLKSLDIEVPGANADTIRRLAAEGVIAERTGAEMAEAAGLRNVLAHEYGHVIDDEVVYDALQDLSRYRAFLVDVREYLADQGAI